MEFFRLIETFRDLHEKKEATLIIISHQERIIQLADKILLVADGNVARYGPRDEVLPFILSETVAGCGYMREDKSR